MLRGRAGNLGPGELSLLLPDCNTVFVEGSIHRHGYHEPVKFNLIFRLFEQVNDVIRLIVNEILSLITALKNSLERVLILLS